MFRFNKNKTEVAIAAPTTTYPTVVEKIHNEFNTAGERLLKEAREIIAGTTIENEEKSKLLKQLGFTATPEVEKYNEIIEKKEMSQKLANILQKLSVKWPKYKFITRDTAVDICKKYNLVLGEVSQYKGFVPEKNLRQIAEFYNGENELNTLYSTQYGGMDSYYQELTKNQYEECMKDQRREHGMRSGNSYYAKEKRHLRIAAPLKDMKGDGYKLKGNIFERETPPDPVVLAKMEIDRIEMFCIVTAWGDEASDPMVVNQINN